MGACSSTTLTDADYYLKNNFEYSKTLALWAFANNIPFFYASSAATYGAGEQGYDDSNEKIHNLKPLNMYGYSKHMFDLWILNNGFENKATGLKFFNVFGPNEYHKEDMKSIVCKKLNEVQAGCIKLFKSYNDDYADGQQKRDFIHVADLAKANHLAAISEKLNTSFNVGLGDTLSVLDLAKAVMGITEIKAKLITPIKKIFLRCMICLLFL